MEIVRKDIKKLFKKNIDTTVYIASSNKNIDIYSNYLEDENVVKVYDIQEEEDYNRVCFELLDIVEKKENKIILISLEGILEKYSFDSEKLEIKKGETIKRKELIELLEKYGYEKNYLIEGRMEYSVRGDIFDFFPINGENPIRIELFGDEIERVTEFSLETQKSIVVKEEVSLYFKKREGKKYNFYDLIEKFREKGSLKVYLENLELFELKFEEAILRDRESEIEYRELLKKLKEIAEIINVKKSEGDSFVKRTVKNTGGVKYENISQIREGDYIIHENFGVGIYLGLKEINGNEYLAIKYADEDRLFVPLDGLKKIEKFVMHSDETPEIYNLGRRGFKKKREKLEKDMLVFAKEIVAIQARRSLNLGYQFSADTVWQEEFEEKFPFSETKDQRKAIEDVKRDMESSKTMDRIVCGDVGFGKTEVAIRAAFKAIMDEKQVLFMAPTTVLAQQHYERIVERYKDYPITVEILSRLSSEKEQKEILKKMILGKVDLVIGTHRLLSNDIKLKDLGLVIVDEEQKFGVKAKEKIKKMRNNVDMLTLTATPIPRTLNYALLGIRDISVIETAPDGRIPVEMNVITDEEKEIKDAIMKEIAREGQVFYIYNRVQGMNNKLEELKKILPKFITIKAIHGKMPPKEIKEILKEFEDGDVDILLSTTIIENGIDIPNANTILIEKMDKLGLSQIYQLRGRVGRGKRKAYCYLVTNIDKKLGKKANERKKILQELKEIGGGFQLALEDMRIRGAGEILGDKQHGALETFGYNLYLKMLKEEIQKVKGENFVGIEPVVKLKGDIYIPEWFIGGDERLRIYRRMLNVDSLEELTLLKEEIRDRFGILPKEAEKMFELLKIKIKARENGILEIEENESDIFIKFENKLVDFEKIMDLIKEKKAKYLQEKGGIIFLGKIDEFFSLYEGVEENEGV